MSLEQFIEVYMMHPLVRHLSSGLLWGTWKAGGALEAFRLSEEGPVGLKNKPIRLQPDATYGLVHPVELSPSELTQWKKSFPSQPFEQLERKIYPSPDVKSARKKLSQFQRQVPSRALLGLLNSGWSRGDAVHSSCYIQMQRKGEGWSATITFEPGIDLSAPTETENQDIDSIELIADGDVPAPCLSELFKDLDELVSPVNA